MNTGKSRTLSEAKMSPAVLDEDLDRVLVDGLLVWKFLLVDPNREARLCRPWLILEELPGQLGPERFAVPRLVPGADWQNGEDYCTWLQAAANEETVPIPAPITLDEVPTFPQSDAAVEQRSRLIRWLLALDIEGSTARQLLQRERPDLYVDGIGTAEHNAAKKVNRSRKTTRAHLSAALALPWTAFKDGKLPPDWRRHPRFLQALEAWRENAHDLWWRSTRENREPVDPTREAALFCVRMAQREWSGLPPVGPNWSDDSPPGAVFGSDTLSLARGRLEVSARAAPEPGPDEWVRRLLAAPEESRKQTDSYLAALDRCHALDELRAAWSRMRPVAGSAVPRCP